MSSRVNEWIGGAKLSQYKTTGQNKHTGVKGTCC
jgi:hypothetical protein